MKKTQLVLIESPETPNRAPWRIDETTRAIGREGLREAREALRAARRHEATVAANPAA
ncbi:MAG: hypothetical protein RIE08_12335 [Acidimicrobiales bacterium]